MTEQAKENAISWAANIGAAMAALDELETENNPIEFEGEAFADADALRDRLRFVPLSIDVRSGWQSPTGEKLQASEYQILLTTGGPAIRIIGDLNEYGEPYGARLQYRDWGTPWLDGDVCDDGVLAFARLFYFGDA